MARRLDHDVLLAHADARAIVEILTDYASERTERARALKGAASRAYCQSTAKRARGLADSIVQRLCTWEPNP